MRLDMARITLLFSCLLWVPAASADSPLLTLDNNPFSKPRILEVKPHVETAVEFTQREPVELELTATMMSSSLPMVIVDGQLLAVGDSIKGLRLVEVMEGRARFKGPAGLVTYSIEEEVQ